VSIAAPSLPLPLVPGSRGAVPLPPRDGRSTMTPERLREAIALREKGLTMKPIAKAVGVSPATVSMYLPFHMARWSPKELAIRREAATVTIAGAVADPTVYSWQRRRLRAIEQHERQIRQCQHCRNPFLFEGRRRKYCTDECAQAALCRQQQQWNTASYLRAVGRPFSTAAISDVVRLDAPIVLGSGGEVDRHQTIASSAFDPVREAESALFDEIVGDLSVDDVARLDDRTLERLRHELTKAGFRPGGVQAKERERLREPEPHRGRPTPAPTHGRVGIGSKRKQREKLAREKHSRPARKPKGHRPRPSRKAQKAGWS
jgi:predicted transcriptional regulator